jgi:hypothetical protein
MKSILPLGLAAVLASVGAAQAAEPTLTATFVDAKTWTGDKLPDGQQCQKFKGTGSVPALKIAGAPAGTTGIVLALNDESNEGMNNGGHGIIRYAVTPANGSVTLPSVPGETDNLPAGVTPVKKHIASAYSGTGGAILPPCSGGRGNTYTATLTATNAAGATLATGRVVLGKY